MSDQMFRDDKASGRLGMIVIGFVAVMCGVLGVVVGLSMGGSDAGASTPSTTVAAVHEDGPQAYQLRCMMTPAGGQ